MRGNARTALESKCGWLGKALKNLKDEANYIALESPKAADDFPDAIFASVDNLPAIEGGGGGSKIHENGRCQIVRI
jgi:plasmid stabilization system protein ParE